MITFSAEEFKGEFFKVLAQTNKSQVAVMTIKPKGDSGPEEIHVSDQIVYVLEGKARVVVNAETRGVEKGNGVIIPAGCRHHSYNERQESLFFLTIYAPPQY